MGERAPTKTLGSVEWEITDTLSGETLYRGRRDLGRDDVEVVEVVPFLERAREVRSGAPLPLWGKVVLGVASSVARAYGLFERLDTGGKRSHYRKRVRLDGDFYFELFSRPSRRRGALAGFGLTAGREAVPTDSWEWFSVGDDGERATKLQEEGELRISLERGRSGDWEVARTEFLTDVWLRMEPEEGAGWRNRPRWRVLLCEGSHIDWPSADGVVGAAPPSRDGG